MNLSRILAGATTPGLHLSYTRLHFEEMMGSYEVPKAGGAPLCRMMLKRKP